MKEVARDQRYACVEAVGKDYGVVIQSTIQNAQIKGKEV